jgi:hypothetical protein
VATPVLWRQRQVDQRSDRSIHAQQRVGELEQGIRPGGQAVIEAGPEPGQYGQGLDAGGILQQTHLHGLGLIISVSTAHLIIPRPSCCPPNTKTPGQLNEPTEGAG